MATISNGLRAILQRWWDDANRSSPSYEARRYGLCQYVRLFASGDRLNDLQDELSFFLRQRAEKLGTCPVMPFEYGEGEHSDYLTESHGHKACHKNVERNRFVGDMLGIPKSMRL